MWRSLLNDIIFVVDVFLSVCLSLTWWTFSSLTIFDEKSHYLLVNWRKESDQSLFLILRIGRVDHKTSSGHISSMIWCARHFFCSSMCNDIFLTTNGTKHHRSTWCRLERAKGFDYNARLDFSIVKKSRNDLCRTRQICACEQLRKKNESIYHRSCLVNINCSRQKENEFQTKKKKIFSINDQMSLIELIEAWLHLSTIHHRPALSFSVGTKEEEWELRRLKVCVHWHRWTSLLINTRDYKNTYWWTSNDFLFCDHQRLTFFFLLSSSS